MSIVAAFAYDDFYCSYNQRRIAVAINVASWSQRTTPFIKAYRLSSQLLLTTSFTAVATDDVASRSQPTILSAVRFEANSLPSRLSPTTHQSIKGITLIAAALANDAIHRDRNRRCRIAVSTDDTIRSAVWHNAYVAVTADDASTRTQSAMSHRGHQPTMLSAVRFGTMPMPQSQLTTPHRDPN